MRKHQWVVMVTYALTDAEALAAHVPGYDQRLDSEHRLSVEGPACMNCEQIWSDQTARSECPKPWYQMQPSQAKVRQL